MVQIIHTFLLSRQGELFWYQSERMREALKRYLLDLRNDSVI
jgi:hypothetical protein